MSIEEDEIIDHDYEAVDTQQEEIMQRETARTNLERLRNLRRLIVMVTLGIMAIAIFFLILAYAIRQLWYEPVDTLVTEDFPPKEVVLKVDGADELIAKMITPEDMQNIIAQQVIEAIEPELERIRLTRNNLESVANQVSDSNRKNQEVIQNFINTSKKEQDNTNKEIEKNAEEAKQKADELLNELRNIQNQSQSSDNELLNELRNIQNQSQSQDSEIANQVEKSIEKVIEKVTEVETVVQKELSIRETQQIIENRLTNPNLISGAIEKTGYIIKSEPAELYNYKIFYNNYSHWVYNKSEPGTFTRRPNQQYCNFHYIRDRGKIMSVVTVGTIDDKGNYKRTNGLASQLKDNKRSESLTEEDIKNMECYCIWWSDAENNTFDGPKHCEN